MLQRIANVVLGLWGVAFTPLLAQKTPSPSDKSQQPPAVFAPLVLSPSPSATRLANGSPSPKYWQNRADYDLKATLDTGAKRVRASMVLRYTNNSPDTLGVIWLQTPKNWVVDDTSAVASDVPGTLGVVTQRVRGASVPLKLEPQADRTVTKVVLAEPLRPGETAAFEGAFTVKQQETPVHQINYWYPRIAVYDDIQGWHSKAGPDDLEFGDFTLEITAPANFTVAATGALDNPADVLSAVAAAKLARAKTSDTVVHVIARDELASGAAHRANQGMLTWKFSARNISNAEWIAASDFLWDATSWQGVVTQSFYRAESRASWDSSAVFVRRSIQEYSERWGPYPYPQAMAVDAEATGYGFPMGGIVTWSDGLDGMGEPNLHFSILTHEMAHQWFPMVVGSSETYHSWMSEGFSTFLQSLSEARWYPADHEQMDAWVRIRGSLNGSAPIESDGAGVGDPYGPPAAGLYVLREYILGPQVFDQALRTYYQRWAYKHPVPADFFRTVEDVSARKLDWFWREWFYEPQTYDMAIDSVRQTRRGDTTSVVVTYRNAGSGVLPIVATLTYSDGTQDVKIQPAEAWQAGPLQRVSYLVQGKTVSKIEIDASHWLPDANPSDNVWTETRSP